MQIISLRDPCACIRSKNATRPKSRIGNKSARRVDYYVGDGESMGPIKIFHCTCKCGIYTSVIIAVGEYSIRLAVYERKRRGKQHSTAAK